MYRPSIDPHTHFDKDGLPKKKQIMVKKYEKPTMTPSGIHLPESFLEDDSGRLWEIVWGSRAAERALGLKLKENDIIRTRESFPAEDVGFEDERDGRILFMMGAEMVYSVMVL